MSGGLNVHEWASGGTDAGAPAPVAILVHGITGWWRTWWRVGPALAARGWRVIAVDQRGHGESPPIQGVANVTTLATDLGAAVEGLSSLPVDLLLGHSLGAAVAMELVHRRPEVCRRLVIEDPPHQTRVNDLEYQANLEREVLAARSSPASEMAGTLAENPTWLEEDARQDVAGKGMCDLDGILASLRNDTGHRVLDLVPQISVPMLYLLADAERSVLGPLRSELIASAPSNATVVEFDSGHTIHRDRFDEYMAALTDWIEQ